MTYYPDAINQYPDRVDKNESGYAITAEYFNVPTSSPYTMYLDHIPKDSDTTKIYASGNHADEWTEVLVAPTATKEFYINYDVGSILFYSGDSGTAVEAEYETLGDDIMAEHMNNMQNEVYGIVSTLGLNITGIYSTLSDRLSNIYTDASINASQITCTALGAGTYSNVQDHINAGDSTYAVDTNPHGISWDILFNTVGNIDTQSGDMNIRNVGGNVVFASGSYMAIGTSGPDQDQYLYFYDNSLTNGQWIKWDDGDDRFEVSDDLYVHGTVSASGNILSSGNYILQDGASIGNLYHSSPSKIKFDTSTPSVTLYANNDNYLEISTATMPPLGTFPYFKFTADSLISTAGVMRDFLVVYGESAAGATIALIDGAGGGTYTIKNDTGTVYLNGDGIDEDTIIRSYGNSALTVHSSTTPSEEYISSSLPVGINNADPAYFLDVAGPIAGRELSADPSDPAEGRFVIWMSDGTGSGHDGDIMIKVAASGVVRTGTLVDFGSLS